MDQKEEERLIIEYFRKSMVDFPKGRLLQSESPDFILKINPKKTIGIELTLLDPFAASLKEKIEATLQNKNEKIKLYLQKNMIAIWLIIHVDFINESKSFHVKNKLDKWIFNFDFDKVFLFDLYEKSIFQLNPYSGT